MRADPREPAQPARERAELAICALTAASFASAARVMSSVDLASAGPSSSPISVSVKPSSLARRMKASRHWSAAEYSRNLEPRRSGSASRPLRW